MAEQNTQTDVLIIGAGASGLMCAIEAARRGRKVVVLDHANKAGKKILMSGGGRCNFTNLEVEPQHFISSNPHFCKSALSRFTQWDFIGRVLEHEIAYHERDHGQLFCDDSSKDILKMLLSQCQQAGVEIILNCTVSSTYAKDGGFIVETDRPNNYQTESLVVACGGLSIPKMGASPFGYKIAKRFSHSIVDTRAALVPFTLNEKDKEHFAALSGIAVDCTISTAQAEFRENLLFTHRGLSGPAVLQVSSYWAMPGAIQVNLLPDINLADWLVKRQTAQPNIQLNTALSEQLPKRLVNALLEYSTLDIAGKALKSLSNKDIINIAELFQSWQIKPAGTEGYRTAEVTLGGVNCNELSSKTMQSNIQQGLYFIGEVVDVTGWLGGYNFQWAWSSGWCAGQVV